VAAEDVDAVFVTHLHLDHCGTVALGRDDDIRPAFPNATYHWTSEEHRYWTEQPDSFVMKRGITGAVEDRFEARDSGAALAPGVTVVTMPGHTPGHAGVVLSSGDARAFLLGDGIACPAQLSEPEWSGMGDVDPKLARRSQEALAKEMEGGQALVGASHFPDLLFGRVLMGEGRRYWQPAT
jgi:glyoxylase-like metal-dependent hydrolase (beta-lactamase superfamily II)